MICGHEWASPQFPLFIVLCFCWIKALSFSSFWPLRGYGMQGRRGGGEISVARVHRLDCEPTSAWSDWVPLPPAMATNSRGGGGVSRSSLNPVNGVHQARSDYGGWGQNALRIKWGISFSPWAQPSINAISRISLKSLLCSLVCNLFVMFQVNLRPGVGFFLAPPPPYGISTLSLKRLT